MDYKPEYIKINLKFTVRRAFVTSWSGILIPDGLKPCCTLQGQVDG